MARLAREALDALVCGNYLILGADQQTLKRNIGEFAQAALAEEVVSTAKQGGKAALAAARKTLRIRA